MDWLTEHKLPIGKWLGQGVDLLNQHASGFFDSMSMVLETILENSGLRKDEEFFIQENTKDENGKINKDWNRWHAELGLPIKQADFQRWQKFDGESLGVLGNV